MEMRTTLVMFGALGSVVMAACSHQVGSPSGSTKQTTATALEHPSSDTATGINKAAGPVTVPGCYMGAKQEPDGVPKGTLWKADIAAVVRSHRDQVASCYSSRLRAVPGLAGKLVFQFSVGADGRIKWSRLVSSTAADAELETCIGGLFCGWQFPTPSGGSEVRVTYPFVLHPPESAPPSYRTSAGEPHNPALNPTGLRPAG
jgi:hypothetical protein